MVSLLGEGEMTHLLKQMWLERPVRFSEDQMPLKKMIEILTLRPPRALRETPWFCLAKVRHKESRASSSC
jgi:hypothetical protein